jgi:hypothetical protein
MECEKFYDKVLKDRNLLRKITSSEKYSWYEPGEIQTSSTSTKIFVRVLSLKNNGKLNKTFFIVLLFHEYRILHNPRPVFVSRKYGQPNLQEIRVAKLFIAQYA